MRTISHTYRQITITACLAISLFLLCSSVAFAQDAYQPLTGIPGVDPDNLSLSSYVNALFLLSIALGAMLAVIKIVIAGFKYMFTDVVTSKQDARSDITGALLGLGILLATFVVLWTINPQLVSLNILTGAEHVGLVDVPDPQANNDAAFLAKCQENTCVGSSDAFKAQCTRTGGTPIPVQPFAALHKCVYAPPAPVNPCIAGPNSYDCKVYTCEQEGGQYVQLVTHSECKKEVEPITEFSWEVRDSVVINFFKNRCSSENCTVLFVGTDSSTDEQKEYCATQGGTFVEAWPYQFQNYNYCTK